MYRRALPSLCILAAVTLVGSCKDSTSPDRPGPPAGVVISAGDGQKGAAGTALPGPIAAKVVDAKGRGVPNVDVSFQALFGSGSVAPTLVRTNSAGVALTTWTLPTLAGTIASVRALAIDTLSGALIGAVTFTATVEGGPAVSMGPAAGTAALAAAGSDVTLKVVLLDAYQNRVSGTTVNWQVTAGGGHVSPTAGPSDANGIASTTLTLGAAKGTNRVTATAGPLHLDLSIEGRIPGEPESISTGSYSPVGPVGGTIPLTARVTDAFGTPVNGSSVTWSVLAGGGSVSPATSTTNTSGVASTQFTLGTATSVNTVEARVGTITTTFAIEGRLLAPRLATTDGSAFGIGRTPGGKFIVSLIHSGTLQTFSESSPGTRQTIVTGGTPVVVAVDAGGTYAYVSNMDGWMNVIDLATDAVVGQVSVPNAHALALSPAGDRVFVTTTTGLVYAVSTVTRQIVGSVAVPNGPWGIAFRATATDSLMYVSSRDGGTVTEVDMKTMTARRVFNVTGRPHGLAISADGQTVYAADNAQGVVKAISTATGNITASVSVPGAFGIAISPDGSTLFVTTDNARGVVIAASSLTITKTYDTASNGRQVIVAPDGLTAWDANEGGWVDILAK